MYKTAHQQYSLGNRVYVYHTICLYDVMTLILCTTTHHRSYDGIIITGKFVRGPIKLLSEPTFLDYLKAQCVGEKWIYQHFTVNYDLSAIFSSLKNGIYELSVMAPLIQDMILLCVVLMEMVIL